MGKQGGGCSWVWGGVQWFGGRLSLIDWLITHLRAYLGSPHFPCQTTFLLHPFPTNLHPQEGKDSYRQHTAGPGELGPEHRLSDATPVTFPSHPLILVPSSFGLTHCQQVSKKRHVVIRRLFFSCTCDLCGEGIMKQDLPPLSSSLTAQHTVAHLPPTPSAYWWQTVLMDFSIVPTKRGLHNVIQYGS